MKLSVHDEESLNIDYCVMRTDGFFVSLQRAFTVHCTLSGR